MQPSHAFLPLHTHIHTHMHTPTHTGEVGIDDALVLETKEEIFEMNNGCVSGDE
jgi:hypothetical protein